MPPQWKELGATWQRRDITRMLDLTGLASLNRTSDRRRDDAKQLLEILSDASNIGLMNPTDQCAFENMKARHDEGIALSEPQLAWLRDMTDRYA